MGASSGEGGNSGGYGFTSGEVSSSSGETTSSSSSSETTVSVSESEIAAAFGESTLESEVVSSENETETTEVENVLTDDEISSAFEENKDQTENMRDPTINEEQLAIIEDMEQKGEMEVDPSQLGETIIGGNHERLGEIHVDMPYNNDAKYDAEGFIEQAQDQEDGLNQLSVQEFLDNYENRSINGRSEEGTKAQVQYNDGLSVSLVNDKMQEGKSYEQAQKEAAEELAGKSALHNPDQVAGGNSTVISSKGDTTVNSAIGSLWGHGRASELNAQVSEMSKNMTAEEKANTYLNVRIDTHSK